MLAGSVLDKFIERFPAAQKTLGVSAEAVYGNLRCFKPRVTAALVRDTAADMPEVIAAMPQRQRNVLPGRDVRHTSHGSKQGVW